MAAVAVGDRDLRKEDLLGGVLLLRLELDPLERAFVAAAVDVEEIELETSLPVVALPKEKTFFLALFWRLQGERESVKREQIPDERISQKVSGETKGNSRTFWLRLPSLSSCFVLCCLPSLFSGVMTRFVLVKVQKEKAEKKER